jgi:hypothetical protein
MAVVGKYVIKKTIKPKTGNCWLCGKSTKLRESVLQKQRTFCDHDHKTGEFRGWLCHHCNAGLGFFHDSIPLLFRAISYLRGIRPLAPTEPPCKDDTEIVKQRRVTKSTPLPKLPNEKRVNRYFIPGFDPNDRLNTGVKQVTKEEYYEYMTLHPVKNG